MHFVQNIENANGNKAVNQFDIQITFSGIKIYAFQSYETVIGIFVTNGAYNGTLYLNEDYYKYSKTTSKYLKIWKREYIRATYDGVAFDASLKDLNRDWLNEVFVNKYAMATMYETALKQSIMSAYKLKEA